MLVWHNSVVQMLSCTPVISGYWANQEDWTDLTGMAITITPKASTNKLLLRAQVHQSSAGGDYTSCIGFKKNGSLLSYTTHNNWGYGDYHEYVSDNDNSLSSGTGQCEREELANGSTSGSTFQVCIRSGSVHLGIIIMYMLEGQTGQIMIGIILCMFVAPLEYWR